MSDSLLKRFCGDTRLYLIRTVLLQCVKLAGSLAFSFAVAAALTAMLEGRLRLAELWLPGLGLLLLLALRFWAGRASTRAQARVVAEVKLSLRRNFLDKLFRLGPSYHRYLPTQAAMQLGVEGVEQLENYFGAYLVQLYYCMVASTVVFLALLPFAAPTALLLFLLSPLIPLFLQLILRMVRRIQKRQWQKFTDVGTLFLDSIRGLTTLKLFGAGQARGERMAEAAETFRRSTMRVLAMQLNTITVVDLIAYGSIAGGFALSTALYLKGSISLFAFFLCILLGAEFFLPMRALTSLFHVAMLGVAAGHEMAAFLEAEEPQHEGQADFPRGKALHIEHLSYTWPGSGTPALKDVSMTLEPGQMTALVGVSGCGKSTLAAWLAGETGSPDLLSHVHAGQLSGSDISTASWRRSVLRMSHESHIFRGTVRDNLLMGRPEASDEELIAALEQVSLWDMLKARDGLDTQLNGRGSNLSGGQAKRLAFARALLRDCELYIFDEAGSNVDVASEAVLLQAMERLAEHKTVLYISHRLDTLTRAQQIYVMDGGEIRESGSHEELMALGGLYAGWLNEQKQLLAHAAMNEAELLETLAEEKLSAAPSSAPAEAAGRGDTAARREGTRSGPRIMLELVQLIFPLIGWVILAVGAGILGFISAWGLAVLPLYALLAALPQTSAALAALPLGAYSSDTYLKAMAVCAVLRAFLHYGEQYCNHNIAFKLLARIRNSVYEALHRLAPAKLDEANPGRLVSILLGDIELLEVFYAHTLSPIAIAALSALVLDLYFFALHPLIGLSALAAQVLIGLVLPRLASHFGTPVSRRIRAHIGELNELFLDRLYGLRELLQFAREEDTRRLVNEATAEVNRQQERLRLQGARLNAGVEALIQLAGMAQILLAAVLIQNGDLSAPAGALAVLLQISSFAPFAALAGLGNTLTQTFACGNRVLDLLEEEPLVPDCEEGRSGSFETLEAEDVCFAYPGSSAGLLKHCSLTLRPGEKVGICGRSGCGKSTLLKLLLRFRDPDSGLIKMGGTPLPEWQTKARYDQVCYLTQTASLFTGTLRENLLLARPEASEEELWQALERAALAERMRGCAEGLDVRIGEDGENFSGGERQRMALARCFLADRDLLMLDEPTSNLDVLNEAMILRALEQMRPEQTVLLVSHRLSTLSSCSRILSMSDGQFDQTVQEEAAHV